MSDTADTRHVKCKFGLVNLAGLIPMRNKVDEVTGAPLSAEILVPLFSHESYKVKTTFNTNLTFFGTSQKNSKDFAKAWFDIPDAANQKHYQKKFRRDVLWDFGDGTQVHGYNAEHYYTKPGRYKITCTFFDINRRGWVNDFCLYVIVKEVIPTMLRFDKNNTKKSIKCSKIERITRVESLISNNVDKELNVSVNRIFSKEEHDSNYKEINRSYDDILKNDFFHMEKYWCTLKNTQTLFYNSDQIYTSELTPTTLYTPQYNKLYCKFFYDEANKESAPIGLSFYQVIPYKKIDDKLKTIKVTNPYTTITDRETKKTYNITQVYTEEQLPEGVTYCGMRGWVDIFYKNDYIGNNNTFTINHDIEYENITGELDSSSNYLNINPLGLSLSVVGNDKSDIRIAMTSNGFLKPMTDGAKLSDAEIFIDQHFRNSLYKGIDINGYIFPYIIYDDSDVKIMNDTYYVPKDVVLGLSYGQNIDEKYGKPSEVNTLPAASPIYPWMYCVPLILNNYIDISFNISTNKDKSFSIRLTQKPLHNPSSINIPSEKTSTVDIDRLLDVYMLHPMFKDKQNLREMMRLYVSSFVEKIISEGENFLDNTANVRTCYLSNLLSTLKMMGQDVTEFEYTCFEGINDLKKFTRLLSINHSDLVGHVIDVDYDITINKDNKGVNVGDCIDIDNVLTLITAKPANNEPNKKDNYGKIQYVQIGSTKHQVNITGGVDLIVHDKYTNDTKIVNFRSYLKNGGRNTVSIADYEPHWDWNLLLPDGFKTLKDKIDIYQGKLNTAGYGTDQLKFFQSEINRLKKTRKELIRSYYDFYLLNPNKDDLRIGNFINSNDITEKIESTAEWEKVWGVTHDILMKIMIENGNLSNNREGGDDYDGNDEWKSAYINLIKSFDKDEVNVTINSDRISLYGDVVVRGEILGEGENTLHVSIDNGLIDYSDEFWLNSNELICNVIDNNISASNTYDIMSEVANDTQIVSGTVTVVLSGSIQNPILTVKADITYSPNITEGEFETSTTFDNIVTYDGNDKTVNGTINANGIVTGVGLNYVELSILNFKVDDISENISIKKGATFGVTVNEDGSLVDKEHEITIKHLLSDENDKITLTGNIKVKMYGTVKNPIIEVISSNFQADVIYPELLEEYTIFNISGVNNEDFSINGGDTIIQSSLEGTVTVPTYFKKSELFVRKISDSWELVVVADIQSKNYKPRQEYEGWQVNEHIEEVFPIEINRWGEIASKTVEITFDEKSTLNTPKLILKLGGNIHESNETFNVSLSEQPKGMYVFLFDLNENYKIGESYNNITFDGLDDYTNVKVFFEDNPILYTKPDTINGCTKNVKLQVSNIVWVDEYEILDEVTGEITIVEAHEEETIEYDLDSKFTIEAITINESGEIVHADITLNFKDEGDTLQATLIIEDGICQTVKSLDILRVNLQKLIYTWSKDFNDLKGKLPYSATLSVNGELFANELQKVNPKVFLQFNVNAELDSLVRRYTETKEVELNEDGTLKQPCEFTCMLTNIIETGEEEDDEPTYNEDGEEIENEVTKDYILFDLNCYAKAKGGFGENFSVSGSVNAEMREIKVWIEFDDEGNLIDADLSGLEDGGCFFYENNKITSFNYDLRSLIDGREMFYKCSNLASFGSKLTSLKAGQWMFESCSLNEDSLIYIANYINDISSLDRENSEDWTFNFEEISETIMEGERGRIDIGYDKTVSQDVLQACGNKLIDKGWDVYFNGTLYEWETPYDVSEANGYCPDASNWNDNVYKDIVNKGYVVESVADGYAWGVKGTEN